MRRRVTAAAVAAVAAVVAAGACAPPPDVDAGMNRYSTDVVLGGPKTTTTLPPLAPMADIDPGFPSFIVPSPPVVSAGAPPLAPLPPEPVACPQAGFEIPPAAPNEVVGTPAPGAYPFRQKGISKVGATVLALPGHVDRVVKNVTQPANGVFRYDVEITQFGETTTTTYEVARRVGQREVDGIHVVGIVKQRPGAAPQQFLPVAPGLRIFALPADTATTWRSVATDPLRATTMTLNGAITERRRVDACGTLIEGWASTVSISVMRPGAPGDDQQTTIEATYVVAPQLGGLIVADTVVQKGVDRGVAVEQSSESVISRTTPR